MDYCMASDAGAAAIWHGQPNLDLDGDGRLDAMDEPHPVPGKGPRFAADVTYQA
jgi:hypothetical protein